MKVKEDSEKAGLKLNIQTSKVMASDTITSWQIDGETMDTLTFFFRERERERNGKIHTEILTAGFL